MSHQTGIVANEALKSFIGHVKEGSVRGFKVKIVKESLTLADQAAPKGAWEDDYDAIVAAFIEPSSPSYIFYRLDSQNNMGFEWIFIAWHPEEAKVKEKMLYAATRATMKKEFGSGSIKDELSASSKDEVTLEGYRRHLTAKDEPGPLTQYEIDLLEVKKEERNAATAPQLAPTGIKFHLDKSATDALSTWQSGSLNYAKLKIDMKNELIVLDTAENIKVEGLASMVPTDSPRYHLYRFSHIHNGQPIASIVFVYSMPGTGCSIKERMLYSSCKAALLSVLTEQYGVTIDRKLEVGSGDELQESTLLGDLHPPEAPTQQKFSRPKAPGRARGTKS